MKQTKNQILTLLFAVTPVHMLLAAEGASSINLGVGGLNPMPHCEATTYTIEYEKSFTPNISLLGRGTGVDYRSDDDDHLEDGKLRGIDLGIRYYYAGQMQGFYSGGSLGYWEEDWTFTQNRNDPVEWKGDANSDAVRLNVDLGYRYALPGSNISIMPEVNLGKFFSSSSCEYTSPPSQVGSKCDEESVVNYYIFAGINVAVAF